MPAGLILAGGRSSRFGSDKAAARIDGRSLLDLGALALGEHCTRLAVSAAPGSAGAQLAVGLGLAVVSDRPGDAPSPLAGVRAGLEWIAELGVQSLAVRAVDTPFIPPTILGGLLDTIGPAPAVYSITDLGPEPLCSLWSLAALPPLAEALASRRHPPIHRFLDSIGAGAFIAPDADVFANINSREDLVLAQSRRDLWWRMR